jgi:CubicO group peptidase (beta-lactamase class C family)
MTRWTGSVKLLWIGAMALAGGCSHAPMRPQTVTSGDYGSTIAYLSALIRYEMDKNAITGLSIALVDDQRVVWAEGFGYADKDKGSRTTTETLYRVGSIAKLFTDTAAMQLVEQGRLALDQPVADYVPGFQVRSRFSGSAAITPRHLMTHHSGLPRDLVWGSQQAPPLAETVPALKESDAAYPPGLVYSYSNVGLGLLGLIVQNVSGAPFGEHLQAAVLRPLGMTHSSFTPGPSPSQYMSRSYGKGRVAHDPQIADVPAGGLNSSVADLSRFLAMVFAAGHSGDHQILKSESLAEMLTPQNASVPLDLDLRIGLGWFLDRSTIPNAGPLAGHGGGLGQFSSQLFALPEHKLGVVVLCNSGAGDVVGRVATDALKLAVEVKVGIRQSARPSKAPAAAQSWSVAAQQEIVGDYTTIAGLAHVYTRGGGLHARLNGREIDLVPRADGQLGLDYRWLGLFRSNLGPLGEAGLSRRTIAGRELVVATLKDREILVGERLKQTRDLGGWLQHLGAYRLVNMGIVEPTIAKFQLGEAKGELFAEISWADSTGDLGSARLSLVPVSDDEAILAGPLAGMGEVFRRVATNGEERLLYRGYVLRKVP